MFSSAEEYAEAAIQPALQSAVTGIEQATTTALTGEVSVTSGVFYFIIMAAVLLLAAYISKRSTFYRKLIGMEITSKESLAESETEHGNRYGTLDGLRGFLALGVLFQHAVTSLTYFSTGTWHMTTVRFYRHAGGEAVIMFFMITSFLYWSKAIKSKGNVDTDRLIKNRFLRLAPMYLFSAAIITLAVLVQARFDLVSGWQFFKDLLSWLSLGLLTTTSMDGISVIPINAGIHWTLHYEWIFYLLLPFMAVALRGGWHRLTAVPFILLALALPDWGYWIIFFFGMFAAHVFNKWPTARWLRKSWASLIPIAGVILVYFMQYKPYSARQYAVSMIVLLCFIYGNSLWGLLRSRAAVFLGTISYSMYLMHGIMLYVVLHFANKITPIIGLSAYCYWSLILLTALLTVLVSTITYRYVEYPFLKKK